MDENQMLAEQLKRYQAQQGGAPQGQMVGNVFVKPHALQYLAAGLRNVGGMRGEEMTRQAMKDQQAKQEALQKEDMGTFLQMLRGRDANPVQMDDEGNQMPSAQIPGDPYAAYSFAMGSQSPMVQKVGMSGISQLPQMEAAKAEKEAARAQQKMLKEAEIAARAEQAQKDREAKDERDKANRAHQEAMARLQNTFAKALKGDKKSEQWKYDAGSDTWVMPPTQEFPIGRSTPNVGKVQAFKNMEYLAGQLLGQDGKGGIIDKATTGGVMGLSGAIGRVTNSQSAREMDNAKEQLSTELRKVFRIPGEGALSDKEQAQYGLQLPDVKNSPELNRKIVNDILVRSRNSVLPPNNPMQQQGGGFKIVGVE